MNNDKKKEKKRKIPLKGNAVKIKMNQIIFQVRAQGKCQTGWL